MSNTMNKVAILFPGTNYSVDCPLLYYAGFSFEQQGYETIAVNYGSILLEQGALTYAQKDIKIQNFVMEQLKSYDLSQYEDVVFISKSIGSVYAGMVSNALTIPIRHIFLTPVKETLPYMKKEQCIVLAGTKDGWLPAKELADFCGSEGIFLKQFEGASHSLNIAEDVEKSLQILQEVVTYFR